MTYQRKIEWFFCLIEIVSMIMVCYGFAYSRNSATLDAFNLDLGTQLSFLDYALFSGLAVCLTPLTMLPHLQNVAPIWRRYLFIAPVLPLLAYVIPFGWVFLRGTGGNPIGGAVYLIVFLIFVGTAFALHRPAVKVLANVPVYAGSNKSASPANY